MKTMNIAVVDHSTVPLNVDFATMIRACQKQVDLHFAPAWGVGCNLFILDSIADTDYAAIVLLNDSDQANALGYHETTSRGNPLGKVFARTSGRGTSTTFSHELLELLGDPDAKQVVSDPKTGRIFALEVCDAIESNSYMIDGVPVSDFVLPAYFDSTSPVGTKLDYLDVLKAPFTIAHGGYMPVQIGGQWTQIFGSEAARQAYLASEHDRSPRRLDQPPILETIMQTYSPTLFAAQEPQLQAQAAAFGLPWDKIKNVVKIFGPDVLTLAKDLVLKGFSISWVIETVQTIQPDVVRLIVDAIPPMTRPPDTVGDEPPALIPTVE